MVYYFSCLLFDGSNPFKGPSAQPGYSIHLLQRRRRLGGLRRTSGLTHWFISFGIFAIRFGIFAIRNCRFANKRNEWEQGRASSGLVYYILSYHVRNKGPQLTKAATPRTSATWVWNAPLNLQGNRLPTHRTTYNVDYSV